MAAFQFSLGRAFTSMIIASVIMHFDVLIVVSAIESKPPAAGIPYAWAINSVAYLFAACMLLLMNAIAFVFFDALLQFIAGLFFHGRTADSGSASTIRPNDRDVKPEGKDGFQEESR